MKSKSSLIWGIFIIGVGILVLINTLGLQIHIDEMVLNLIIGGFLILYGSIRFFQRRYTFLPFFAFYTGLGFILFIYLKYFNYFTNQIEKSSVWMFVCPAAILATGTMLIAKSFSKNIIVKKNNYSYYNEGISHDNKRASRFTEEKKHVNIQNLFTSNITVVTSKQFQGGFASNRFSETTIDLKQVELTQDAILTLENLCGSIQIIIPRSMKVQVVVIDNMLSTINEIGKSDNITGINQLTLNINTKLGEIKIIRA